MPGSSFVNNKKPFGFPLFANALAAMSLAFCAQFSFADTKVIGYIPAYKGLSVVANKTDFTKLTHINLSFLNPNSSGVITSGGSPVCMEGGSASELNYVVQKAHQNNVKVLISLA